jgi:hypothetical protein
MARLSAKEKGFLIRWYAKQIGPKSAAVGWLAGRAKTSELQPRR